MNRLFHIFVAAALTTASLSAFAQTNGSNSPYSRYGFGLLSDGGNAFNKGMAGTALGMRHSTELNTKNPASYSAIDSLSFIFDFGLSMQNGNFAQNGTKVNAKNTSIDYITAGFRIAPGLGMSAGLIPFSTIGYQTKSEKELESNMSILTQTNTFSGDGGLHELYLGLGWAPIKQLSIGANVGYLWGDLTHNAGMTFSESGTTLSSIRTTNQGYYADIRTYKADFGLQYEQRINKNHKITLGLAYGLGHNINRKAEYYNQLRQSINSSTTVTGDTLTCPNAFQLPHTFGAGLTWAYKNSLRVGVDYYFQKWGDVKSPTLTADNTYEALKGNYKDLHKISVGIEYIPDPEGLKWRQRVRYRAGFAYSSPYILTDGKDGPDDYLASVGVAMPIANKYGNRTYINVGMQYEHVHPKMAGQITENYIRLSIGITFNERWFMKWKAQ